MVDDGDQLRHIPSFFLPLALHIATVVQLAVSPYRTRVGET